MTALCSLMMGASFASCSEDNDNEPQPTIDPVENHTLILHEGNWGDKDAGIALYHHTSPSILDKDIYRTVNGKQLGDVGNALTEEDDNLYVVLSSSKYVARLDKQVKEQARYTFPEGEGEPRCIDVEDGYAYVTQHGGQVSKISTKDMTLAGTFKGGDNLEGIVEKDGKLYVANAWKSVYEYNQEIIVIDANTMTKTNSIEVVLNPIKVQEIGGKIYVISQGNYMDVPAALQVIDTKAGTSKVILNDVTKITEGLNGLIYGVCSTYDAEWNSVNSFFTYNPSTGAIVKMDAPHPLDSSTIYLLEVDEEHECIYIGTTDYVNTGTIYQFDKEGKPVRTFDSMGINPSAMIFVD